MKKWSIWFVFLATGSFGVAIWDFKHHILGWGIYNVVLCCIYSGVTVLNEVIE